MKTIGVIGGSGLYEMDGLSDVERVRVETPWGDPSSELVSGAFADARMVFLPRHGEGHALSPSEINFRANVYAMKTLGVERIVSVSAVGSMKEEIEPGHVVIPDQFIDNTRGRESSFFEGGAVAHVSMADPVCPVLSDVLRDAASGCGAVVHAGGTYICIEGPQFSTRAESGLYRQWGVDVIGMTAMPEAKLAREAGICYCTVALSTDYDCWNDAHDDVTVADVIETMNRNVAAAKNILAAAVPAVSENRECGCSGALRNSVITPERHMDEDAKDRLSLFLKGRA